MPDSSAKNKAHDYSKEGITSSPFPLPLPSGPSQSRRFTTVVVSQRLEDVVLLDMAAAADGSPAWPVWGLDDVKALIGLWDLRIGAAV